MSDAWSADNFKKTADLGEVQLETAIWSRVAGDPIPCFDRCQMTGPLMSNINSNIKDVCCKLTELQNDCASHYKGARQNWGL